MSRLLSMNSPYENPTESYRRRANTYSVKVCLSLNHRRGSRLKGRGEELKRKLIGEGVSKEYKIRSNP